MENTGALINSIVGRCKILLASNDPNSRRMYNTYRVIVIGNYSLYLIRLYNNYAKQYSLDANDLVHIPYVHFGTLVKNFNPDGGASFNSYMVLCLHGYIKKFISEDALVYVNPSKKTTVSYVETTKIGKDGDEIEFLHSIEPFDADSQGKLQFASKMYEKLAPEMQDMYGYLVTTESPKQATDIFAETHSCSNERAVQLLSRMRRKIRLEWTAKQ
jgi:DNA-directed RNA polymerase specialized sigma subunit